MIEQMKREQGKGTGYFNLKTLIQKVKLSYF